MKLATSKLNKLYKPGYTVTVSECRSTTALVNYHSRSASVRARRGGAYLNRCIHTYRSANGETGSRKVRSYRQCKTNWTKIVRSGVVGNSFSICDGRNAKGIHLPSRNSLVQGMVLSNTIESMYGSIKTKWILRSF